MQILKCLATDCVYNSRGKCGCPNIKMSAKAGGAKCGSFEGLPNYRMHIGEDTEFARDFTEKNVTCSAESCVFNIHYSCKAGEVKVDSGGKSCKSYYGM